MVMHGHHRHYHDQCCYSCHHPQHHHASHRAIIVVAFIIMPQPSERASLLKLREITKLVVLRAIGKQLSMPLFTSLHASSL